MQIQNSIQSCYITKQINTRFNSRSKDVWAAEKVFCFSTATIIREHVMPPQGLLYWPRPFIFSSPRPRQSEDTSAKIRGHGVHRVSALWGWKRGRSSEVESTNGRTDGQSKDVWPEEKAVCFSGATTQTSCAIIQESVKPPRDPLPDSGGPAVPTTSDNGGTLWRTSGGNGEAAVQSRPRKLQFWRSNWLRNWDFEPIWTLRGMLWASM